MKKNDVMTFWFKPQFGIYPLYRFVLRINIEGKENQYMFEGQSREEVCTKLNRLLSDHWGETTDDDY